MMNNVHSTAIIESGAKIGKNVTIGPFCFIGQDVVLDDNVELKSHVVIDKITRIGSGTIIHPFVRIGGEPQNINFQHEPSTISIGKNNTIRENVTIHPGTKKGIMKTEIGDNCFLMVGAHIAHDCILGNNIIMANNATLGGHVTVGDFAVFGGLVAVHQFIRIGEYSMIGGTSGIKYDVPPFSMVVAQEPDMNGINIIGIKRAGMTKLDVGVLKSAYDILFSNINDGHRAIEIVEKEFGSNAAVQKLLEFMKKETARGLRKSRSYYEKIKI